MSDAVDDDDDDKEETEDLNKDIETQEVNFEEVEVTEQEYRNHNIPQPIPKPPYAKPTKGDKIIFSTLEGLLTRATVLTKSCRYKGEWYNVRQENRDKLSIQLIQDSYWKFEHEERNGFFK